MSSGFFGEPEEEDKPDDFMLEQASSHWMKKKRKQAMQNSFFMGSVDVPFSPMLVMERDQWKNMRYPAAAEVKYDGIRAIVHVNRGRPAIQTRNGHDYTDRYPSLCFHLAKLPAGTYDGEIYHPRSRGSASALKDINQASVNYRVFDVPKLNQPYAFRRVHLTKVVGDLNSDRIVASDVIGFAMNYTQAKGFAMKIIAMKGEGVVMKPLDSMYYPGKRKEWMKIKE